MQLSETVLVQAPVERVFDCWADLERSPEHQRPTLARTKLTDGTVGEGTRFSAIDRWPGRNVTFEMEITEFERPLRLAARWEEPMAGSWEARFEQAGDATRMEFDTTIEPGGLMGLLTGFLKPWAGRQLEEGLESFRNWIEAGICSKEV